MVEAVGGPGEVGSTSDRSKSLRSASSRLESIREISRPSLCGIDDSFRFATTDWRLLALHGSTLDLDFLEGDEELCPPSKAVAAAAADKVLTVAADADERAFVTAAAAGSAAAVAAAPPAW